MDYKLLTQAVGDLDEDKVFEKKLANMLELMPSPQMLQKV